MKETIQRSIQRWDEAIAPKAERIHHPFLTHLFRWVTFSGTGKVWLAFLLVIFVMTKVLSLQKEATGGIIESEAMTTFLKAAIAPGLAWFLSTALKKVFRRPRPYQVNVSLKTLGPREYADDSFPSSHSAASVAFFVALSLIHHPWAPLVGTWSLLVVFSRYYLGFHFVSDLVGGVILGVLSAFICSGIKFFGF